MKSWNGENEDPEQLPELQVTPQHQEDKHTDTTVPDTNATHAAIVNIVYTATDTVPVLDPMRIDWDIPETDQ